MSNSFLSRWSQRKAEQEALKSVPDGQDSVDEETSLEQDGEARLDDQEGASDVLDESALELGAAEEPAPESQDDASETDGADSEPPTVAELLAMGADAAVKKQALRSLFLSGEFSEVDRLNDYDHDYKAVKSLSSEAVQKLRDWMQEEVESEIDEDDQAQITEANSTEANDTEANSTEISDTNVNDAEIQGDTQQVLDEAIGDTNDEPELAAQLSEDGAQSPEELASEPKQVDSDHAHGGHVRQNNPNSDQS
ncbi:DUF3306 domain-containing protein [Vibrio sp. WXL103]|uniref:DUF3306 domain-containing protein n=1 Tax=unclassified Vibrio TaxID=2614977 RepID=UPI003EC9173A